MTLDPLPILTARYFLALLLLAAGAYKIANLKRFQKSIAAYRAVPVGLENVAAWLVVSVEVIMGITMMLPGAGRSASWAATILFAAYFTLMGASWVRGVRDPQCGCSFQRIESTISGFHLMRNVVLVFAAVVASASNSGRELSWLDCLQMAAAVTCLGLAYLSVDGLLAYFNYDERRGA